ncbi:XRE family transcriptional regulator [Rhodoplanes sp. TEM]|uniref:XRE family transcriptional regulator n=1 Tax=Rhodoplanes tepidamans TaxID=200616 RepID=A0ABT5JEU2_RHOTP|nr:MULTISPECIES: XRE family transcriptional regulator [Rhodoplanes]MDC7788018.1 XRE family transcriptional regulator [Rhodoplanes tepidamans]MDC7984858.1 XRE family transcriptional regulator [Rhodoplanes sp. TEM]MDQ0358447.1 SOS-response transcriptional repressor LexA [Rhodoplanes tepidamans]
MARADELWELTRTGLFDRLKRAVQDAGGNAFVSARSGVPLSTLNTYLAGATMPSLAKLASVARACGISLDYLVTGKGEAVETTKNWPERLILIQSLAFRASAGDGLLIVDEESETTPFPRQILDRLGLKASKVRLLEAAGNSMSPTIEDGDPLLVELGETSVADGRIYVFTIGDQVLVKRLRRRGSCLLMRADNRELYPDEEDVPTVEPVRIIGRVRWVGRSL